MESKMQWEYTAQKRSIKFDIIIDNNFIICTISTNIKKMFVNRKHNVFMMKAIPSG